MCVNSETCQCGNTNCYCKHVSAVPIEVPGMFCRTGCITKDHYSYGECMRSSRIGISPGETSKGRF